MPLSIIKGYAELLLSGDIDRESEPQYLEKIIERSQSIVDFFPKIQDRLELKELQEEKREPVDLLQLVRDCTQEIKNGMCFDTIRIQVLSQEDSLLILSSPERINEIIYNLLENAAKYMQRQGIVTFRLWKDLGMVHMHVRDDGMGLKKEEASRIFEKNYQGSNQRAGAATACTGYSRSCWRTAAGSGPKAILERECLSRSFFRNSVLKRTKSLRPPEIHSGASRNKKQSVPSASRGRSLFFTPVKSDNPFGHDRPFSGK